MLPRDARESVDFLIIRNKCDRATEYTNWIGEGLREYLEQKSYSVTDLSGADASPEKVTEWLRLGKMKTMKVIIALDHGSPDSFSGEQNGNLTQVIDLANVEDLTKRLHVYAFACSTNAEGGLGQKAVDKGCFSWLGYKETVYVLRSESFKNCIWSYIQALAEGKTIEECQEALKMAYQARAGESPYYQYNLDRMLLRKNQNSMTINSHNRASSRKV